MEKTNLCIIGCGGITETFYLPNLQALSDKNELEVFFIEKNEERLRNFARQYQISDSKISNDVKSFNKTIDGFIVATPPHTHYNIISELLETQAKILCEKPAVESTTELESLLNHDNYSKGRILVNNTRRFFPSYKKVKSLIESGTIGDVKSVEYYEGSLMNWQSASNSYFATNGKTPKGILMDRGAHVLDAMAWWTNDNPVINESKNDSFGGPESLAELRMSSDKIEYYTKMSWLNKLSNSYKITGEKGTISGDIYDWNRLTVNKNGKSNSLNLKSGIMEFTDFGYDLLENFIKMIKEEEMPVISLEDVAPSIKLIDDAYKKADQFNFSWLKDLEGNNE